MGVDLSPLSNDHLPGIGCRFISLIQRSPSQRLGVYLSPVYKDYIAEDLKFKLIVISRRSPYLCLASDWSHLGKYHLTWIYGVDLFSSGKYNFTWIDGVDLLIFLSQILPYVGDRRGRDRMAVGFQTTYAVNTYHH